MSAAGSTGRHEPKKCGGTRSDGKPCRLPAGAMTDHVGYGKCKFHTGSTPNGKKAAEAEREREVKAQASALLQAHGIEARDVSDVYVLLGEMVGRMVGLVDMFERKASELDGLTGVGIGGEYERIMLKLYRESVRDTSALLRDVAKLDIEERQLRLDEKRALVVRDLLQTTLADPRSRVPAERVAVVLSVFAEYANLEDGRQKALGAG